MIVLDLSSPSARIHAVETKEIRIRRELIELARSVCGEYRLRKDFFAGSVGAAIRTEKGNVYTGICLDLGCGLGFCAEVAAIAEMLKHRETRVTHVAAVRDNDGMCIPPCGRCRETLAQVDPGNLDCKVILGEDRETTLRDMLPQHWLGDSKPAEQIPMKTSILTRVARKGSDKAKLAADVVEDPSLLPDLLEGLRSDKAAVKYGSEKVLRLAGEMRPALLYPHFDLFAEMLDSPNSFLKWGAILTIANLAAVDGEGRIERIFDKYFSFIAGSMLISAANAISGAAKIALAKPHLADRIAGEILRAEKARYSTPECTNVACGHALDALAAFRGELSDERKALAFAERQLSSSRPAVRKKAARFLASARLRG